MEYKRINKVGQEYEAIVMEKCVDSDFMQPENDSSKPSENASSSHDSSFSNKPEEKNRSKSCSSVSRVRNKIASKERSSVCLNPKLNVTLEKSRRHRIGTNFNVLNKHVTETARQSVQKKTKIIKSNVPDRLGKHVSYRVRPETKILLNDCKLEIKSSSASSSLSTSSSESPTEAPHEPSVGALDADVNRTDTNVAVLGNECLNNKEADRLRNSFESDLETKNIFENFFDDRLKSTSNGNEASSQEDVNKEKMGERMKEVERRKEEAEMTPEKRRGETPPPGAPVKLKDHSDYYTSHKNIRHVCAYCHKIFKSNGKLNSHVYSHTGERPFDCNHCGKAFSSKFKLVRHLLIHSEVRKFVCQICDRTFLRNDHLKNHYKVHDPQKKMYKCPKANCDKEYSSMMSHKKHMAYHNVEDGDLKCLICSVKYETKEEILFHLKSHSGSRLFKSQSDKKFKCQFCDRLFLTRKDVTRHLVVHTGERDFLCQFCPQRFGRKDHLVRHIKKSHGNEELVRSEEGKTTRVEEARGGETPAATPDSNAAEVSNPTKENNTQTEENKTHIVITVQEKTLQGRTKRKLQKKPFQKNDLLVPKKKQVPLVKAKNPTTQILLENIPNILIIPNNSIILLRNQNDGKKSPEELQPPEPEPPVSAPEMITLPSPSPSQHPPPSNDFINFPFHPSIFPSPPQFLHDFHAPDAFPAFQPDLPFGPQFDEPDFEMLNQSDLLPRAEGGLAPSAPAPPPDPGKHLFGDGSDSLMLNETILGEFKDDSSAVLPAEGDVGILGNILNQPSDNCGFELLRHLLTTENPALSPLPGFSQIFHNSNANPD